MSVAIYCQMLYIKTLLYKKFIYIGIISIIKEVNKFSIDYKIIQILLYLIFLGIN